MHLKQVLHALASNACQFTTAAGGAGGVAEIHATRRVSVADSAPMGERDTYTFAVTDTGPGIPRASQQKIFDKFSNRVHLENEGAPEEKRETQAMLLRRTTGVGLPLAQTLVRLMGARAPIEVVSPWPPRPGDTDAFGMPVRNHLARPGSPPLGSPREAAAVRGGGAADGRAPRYANRAYKGVTLPGRPHSPTERKGVGDDGGGGDDDGSSGGSDRRTGRRGGAMFRFTLTFHKQSPRDVARLARQRAALMHKVAQLPGELRCLCADDTRMNRWMLRQMLGHLGKGRWSIDECETGEEALQMVQGEKVYDIVFLDEDFGYDPVAKKVRRTGSAVTPELRFALAGKKTLVVGCTGFVSEEHRSKARAVGQDDIIGKPLRTRVVRELLVKHFAS